MSVGRAPWEDGRVDLDRGWRFVSIGVEGQPAEVAGVNLWEGGVGRDRWPDHGRSPSVPVAAARDVGV